MEKKDPKNTTRSHNPLPAKTRTPVRSVLEKTFLQPDQQTMSSIKDHTASLAVVPKDLMKWGIDKLSKLPKDAIESVDLDGKTIKVRKYDSDLYSGWIESAGNKLHNFERITLPELLTQLQSKLELYGREKDAVGQPEGSSADVRVQIQELRDRIRSHLSESGMELDEKEFSDTPPTDPKVSNTTQIQGGPGDSVVVPGKELADGMAEPESECAACERPVDQCLCYMGLPRPRLEFDGKKVTIFFKSEWDQDARESFVEDLKRRAGRILKRRALGGTA